MAAGTTCGQRLPKAAVTAPLQPEKAGLQRNCTTWELDGGLQMQAHDGERSCLQDRCCFVPHKESIAMTAVPESSS